ncbi:MAG: VWA domain-containing protein [Spirochaetales bacterium]|nr:VWA domain-containing protein [Spirochaetales bacterium]
MRKNLVVLLLMVLLSAFLPAQDCGVQVENADYNNFVLIADRSGSMSTGSALVYSMVGIGSFLGQLQGDDWVSLITFSDDIRVDQEFTQDVGAVFSKVKTMTAGGGTRLYDAIAKGIQILSPREGRKVIIFLTDGIDNGSRFSVKNLAQMNVGEDVFLYGIGLGDVEERVLRNITNISRGTLSITPSPEELQTIYSTVRDTHYTLAEELETTGRYSITSIPSGQPVRVDGQDAGTTPLRLLGFEPGEHNVEVDFSRGIWSCSSDLQAGYTCYVTAREADLPNDLIIETAPTNAAVFIDDSYAGFSSMIASHIGSVSDQLVIKGLAPGKHVIRVVPAPDTGMTDDMDIEFEINMTTDPLFIKVEVFMGRYKIISPATGEVLEEVSTGGFGGGLLNFNFN